MSDTSSQTEQVESGVHIGFAQRIEDSAYNIRNTSPYQPPKGGSGSHCTEVVQQRFHGNQYTGSHPHITNCLKIAVFFKFFETYYETGNGGQPDERENPPTPSACMSQGEQCERRISSCNMQIDSSVVELTEQFFLFPRTAAMIARGTDVGRKHPRQIDNDARYRPLRFTISESLFQ